MLVQNAANQARIAVEHAVLGEVTTRESSPAPQGGFTDPEYGGVGYTEQEATEEFGCIVARVPFESLDRAIIDGRTEGFLNLIADAETHKVIGAAEWERTVDDR